MLPHVQYNMSASTKVVTNQKDTAVKWSLKEQLILASAVQRSGDQNWVSVSRAVKPLAEESRPPEFYSQKNCATQYSVMLDKASTPKRKRKEDGSQEAVETVEEQIVRHLTAKRIKELDKTLSKIKEEYMSVKKEVELIEKGELDDQLQTLLQEGETNNKTVENTPKTGPDVVSTNTEQQKPEKIETVTDKPHTLVTGAVHRIDERSSQEKEIISKVEIKKESISPIAKKPESAKITTQPNVETPLPTLSTKQALAKPPKLQIDTGMEKDKETHLKDKEKNQGIEEPMDVDSKLKSPEHQIKEPILSITQIKVPVLPIKSPVPEAKGPVISVDLKDPLITVKFSGTSNLTSENETSKVPVKSSLEVKGPVKSSLEVKGPVKSSLEVKGPVKSSLEVKGPVLNSPVTESKLVVDVSEKQMPSEKEKEEEKMDTLPVIDEIVESQVEALTDSRVESVKEQLRRHVATRIMPQRKSKMSDEEQAERNDTILEQPESQSKERETSKVEKKEEGIEEKNKELTSLTEEKETKEKDDKDLKVKEEVPVGRLRRKKEDERENTEEGEEKGMETESEEEEIEKRDTEEEDEEVLSPLPLSRILTRRKKRQSSLDSGELPPQKATKNPSSERGRKSVKVEEEKEEESVVTVRNRRSIRTPSQRGRGGRSSRFRNDPVDTGSPKLDPQEEESEEEIISALSSAVPSPTTSQGDNDPETHQMMRNWRKTIMLVWRHAAQHKYANLFLHPVKEEDAPGYYEIILRPMDLTTIKKNIETGVIYNDIGFQRDMLLMFQNALMYNSSDHDVYKMAEEMRNDVMENIHEYLLTQLMVHSTSIKSLRSREAKSSEERVKKLPSLDDPSPAKKGRRLRLDD